MTTTLTSSQLIPDHLPPAPPTWARAERTRRLKILLRTLDAQLTLHPRNNALTSLHGRVADLLHTAEGGGR